MRKEGEIIYWNGEYGFIQCSDYDQNIFFHQSRVEDSYEDIQLLDQISFKVGLSKNPKHYGAPTAYRVRFIGKGELSKHTRTIGHLRDWNGRYGFLESPQLDSNTFLYHTRLTQNNWTLKSEDTLVFSPVKSNKNPDDLFAFFAYPLTAEKDNAFLLELWEETSDPPVGEILALRNEQKRFLPFQTALEIVLEQLWQKEEEPAYQSIEDTITVYQNKYAQKADWEFLKFYFPPSTLLMLWENDVIASYDLSVIATYFLNSNAATKREVISKLGAKDQGTLLNSYYQHLLSVNRLNRINNHLKTLLDIIYRNPETHQEDLYKQVEAHLYQQLEPSELLQLSGKGYISSPSRGYLTQHFDFFQLLQSRNQTGEWDELLQSLAEDLLSTLGPSWSFAESYDQAIISLRFLKEIRANSHSAWLKVIGSRLKEDERFVIWLFCPDLLFEGHTYLADHWEQTDPFWVLYYLVKVAPTRTDLPLEKIRAHITEESLVQSAQAFRWNTLIHPVAEEDQCSYMKLIREYNSIVPEQEVLDLNLIGETLYKSFSHSPHIQSRLWLYDYVAPHWLDYEGFRIGFKELSKTEQKEFRRRANRETKDGIEQAERLAVLPCNRTVPHGATNDSSIYLARINNIHFKESGWALRRQDGDYTLKVEEPRSSPAFNRLPTEGTWGEYEFRIQVQGNSVSNIDALDQFFFAVHESSIEKSLQERTRRVSDEKSSKVAYPEDFALRKQIIAFLHEQQIPDTAPVILEEARIHYRRLDEKTPGAEIVSETTQIFTLDLGNEFLLVWENTELSEDRATFLFKCTEENYHRQLNKLIQHITTHAQFRSTLVSKADDPNVLVFRDNLGFIGKVLKPRGQNDAFTKWRDKLENAELMPISRLPDEEQVAQLKNWQLSADQAPVIGRSPQYKSKKIEDHRIRTVDTKALGIKNKPTGKQQNSKHKQILQKLREINAILKPTTDA